MGRRDAQGPRPCGHRARPFGAPRLLGSSLRATATLAHGRSAGGLARDAGAGADQVDALEEQRRDHATCVAAGSPDPVVHEHVPAGPRDVELRAISAQRERHHHQVERLFVDHGGWRHSERGSGVRRGARDRVTIAATEHERGASRAGDPVQARALLLAFELRGRGPEVRGLGVDDHQLGVRQQASEQDGSARKQAAPHDADPAGRRLAHLLHESGERRSVCREQEPAGRA
jgi:hypothetical protein